MDSTTIISTVDRILIEEFELAREDVVPGALLRDDLDLDSLDAVDLVVVIEREFGVRLDDKLVMKMRLVSDIHDYVRAECETKSA